MKVLIIEHVKKFLGAEPGLVSDNSVVFNVPVDFERAYECITSLFTSEKGYKLGEDDVDGIHDGSIDFKVIKNGESYCNLRVLFGDSLEITSANF